MENENKNIAVYALDGRYLSSCTEKRAAQMVSRMKAVWRTDNAVTLIFDRAMEKETRKRVLERDGLVCYICEKDLAVHLVTYDHVIPRIQGGTDFEDNLAICCHDCNNDKANRTPKQYTLYLYAKILNLLGGN